MLPTVEAILRSHESKPNKVQRIITKHKDTVYFVYVSKKGEAYTVLLDLDDWDWLKNLTITVGLVGKLKTPAVTVRYNGENYVLARLVLNAPDDKVVDHIDWNTLNNKKRNLRLCTESENAQNRLVASNNTSGVRCISWSAYYGKWTVNVTHDNKTRCLGKFDDIKVAVETLLKYKIHNMPFTPEAREYHANIPAI